MASAVTTQIKQTLEALRKSLTTAERKIVTAVTNQFERDLIDALPEIQEGVQTSAAEGSFSTTLQIKAAKKSARRFIATLKPRVRVPREPTEFDMHVADDGQLALGFLEEKAAEPEPEQAPE
jgi:hypothetical protein